MRSDNAIRIFLLTILTYAWIIFSPSAFSLERVVRLKSVSTFEYMQPAPIQTYELDEVRLLKREEDRQINCLAKNIYFEARNQPLQGQIAVALVTFNRAKSGVYPNNICDVVYQKRKGVCQFTWVCYNHKITETDTWKDIWLLSRQLYINKPYDFTNGARFYHADYVQPNWNFLKLERVAMIGDHIFYRCIKTYSC